MKPRLIIPALAAAIAAGGAFYTLQAQDSEPKREQRRNNADAAKDQMRRMMERMDLSDEARRQFEKALENWGSGNDADDNSGQPRQFRFEYRNDGSRPRFFRDGKEVKPGANAGKDDDENADPREELHKQMEELFKRQMGGDNDNDNPLEELFRRMGRPGQRGNDQNPNQMQDLFRMFQNQQGGNRGIAGSDSRYSKFHRGALAEWRPLTRAARESTVRIMRDNKQVAFGTIVSADGYALTKASEVNKDGLECEFHDGRIVPAKVVDKMDSYDLALIKLEATGLTPVTFSANEAAVGTIVAAVGVDEDPLAVGIISVAARSLSEKGKGALGIQFAREAAEKGVAVGQVFKGSPAAEAGLKEGDAILAVNGTAVDSSYQLLKMIASMRPGENVKLRYERDGKEAEMEFTLTSRDELGKLSGTPFGDRRLLDPTAQMGSVLSGNASGYPNAVQSDLTIDSNDCGSPVVDVDGHVVAINIARSERVSTYMIPGKVIQALLSNLPAGKFTLAKDADTLNAEVRDYDITIRKAQEALKAAEAGRAAAQEALKKHQR
ncbi:MAG TPA: PDZ domain-containing protein [Verrucomicrobiales bacterium]|nr:PDZ domain-containing protein [Verrucomicrobiales bacterium]